jgi:hypothetical protein
LLDAFTVLLAKTAMLLANNAIVYVSLSAAADGALLVLFDNGVLTKRLQYVVALTGPLTSNVYDGSDGVLIPTLLL